MLPALFKVHTVTVEPQLGEGGLGDVYGPSIPILGFLDYTTRLVRSRTGAEVVSSSTFYTELSEASQFPLDSKVTLPDGRITYVLAAAPRDDGGLTGLAHLEIALR